MNLQNMNLFSTRAIVSAQRGSNVMFRVLNSLWSICHKAIALCCQIIHQLCMDRTSDMRTCNSSPSLIPCLWLNGIWRRQWSRFMQTRSEIKTLTKFWKSGFLFLGRWNMGIKGQERRWKIKQWVWGGSSGAPVSNRGGVGVCMMEDERPLLATEPKQLQCSWETSIKKKKPFSGRCCKGDSFRSQALIGRLDVAPE